MILVNFNDLQLGFGGFPLFEKINGQIRKGEKIAFIGRNGSGKTTLLQMFNQTLIPDTGSITFSQNLRVSYLSQTVPEESQAGADPDPDLFSFVFEGAGEVGKLLAQYKRISERLSETKSGSKSDSDSQLRELDRISDLIEIHQGWEIERKVNEILKRFNLNPSLRFSLLSAGKKRVALLTRALISNPDLLLLDEPTNHLDIDMITWLESFIDSYSGTILYVTHDRRLIEKTATVIWEIDRGELSVWNCSYNEYLDRKKAALEVEEGQRKLFMKRLSDEEVWIRQGIKARRTRNEGRVKRLKQMREARMRMRQASQNADFSIQNSNISGKIVIRAKNIRVHYDGLPIIDRFSTLISRGDRIGIIGANGCGKTTLLNVLLKQNSEYNGDVEHGSQLQITYFDQLKRSLDEKKTIVENVGDGNDLLQINGKTKHIYAYLQDFLFSPDRAKTKVGVLSGGEKSRVMLAKLFTQPSNLLVLDEPTNDLDIETLELLEEILIDFPGTLLIVSHDRTFLDNVATSIFLFRDGGRIEEFIGGYSDIRNIEGLRLSTDSSADETKESIPAERKKSDAARPPQAKKLSYKEQQELDALPRQIEEMEERKEVILVEMADPELFSKQGDRIAKLKRELEQVENDLKDAYFRWETLEQKQQDYEMSRLSR